MWIFYHVDVKDLEGSCITRKICSVTVLKPILRRKQFLQSHTGVGTHCQGQQSLCGDALWRKFVTHKHLANFDFFQLSKISICGFGTLGYSQSWWHGTLKLFPASCEPCCTWDVLQNPAIKLHKSAALVDQKVYLSRYNGGMKRIISVKNIYAAPTH